MYFNERKKDTNIDKEFKKKINFDFKKLNISLNLLLIIGGILLFIIILIIIFSISKNRTKYFISLDGDEEITIYKDTTYIEPGYTAFDNKSNLLTDQVKVVNNVNTNNIGTYEITYTLRKVTKTRTVKVVEKPENSTFIHLNGDKNMTIKLNETYTEPGYNAVDIIDGDLTSKVTATGSVNTSQKGIYRIIYSVVNSRGVTTSVVRTIVVE